MLLQLTATYYTATVLSFLHTVLYSRLKKEACLFLVGLKYHIYICYEKVKSKFEVMDINHRSSRKGMRDELNHGEGHYININKTREGPVISIISCPSPAHH